MNDFGFVSGGFRAFGTMFTIAFALIVGTFIVLAVRGIGRWNRNNRSPRLRVSATVVTKRMDVVRRGGHAGAHAGMHGAHGHTSTRYYATFEVESGDRMELCVDGEEYGMLVEGDRGTLSFQGDRYLGFERL